MSKLSKLEKILFEKLSSKYPCIKDHIPLLEVKNREITGVGMYVNLFYNKENFKKLNIKNTSISGGEIIEMKELEYGLSYEIAIEDGEIKFIEFVTHGEKWSGVIPDDFYFT
jgi:hypothetical protein